MTFSQSIKTCFRKYFVFKGRATRSEFWWFQLFATVISIGAMTLDHLLLGYSLEDPVTLLSSMSMVILALPTATVTARRLHDIGWSGWLQLPVFGSFLAFVDVWVPDFSLTTFGSVIISGAILYWIGLCLFLIKDSQPLTNKYGSNPKNPDMGRVFG